MDRLPSRVNRADPEFSERKKHNEALIAQLRERLATASNGGGGKYVDRHRSRGKHLPRERIERIIDQERHFWNSLPLAAHELYDGRAHSAGIVTGIGMVHGRECLFVANDATRQRRLILSNDGQETHRAQTVAHENNLPASTSLTLAVPFCPCKTRYFLILVISDAFSATRLACQGMGFLRLQPSWLVYGRWGLCPCYVG